MLRWNLSTLIGCSKSHDHFKPIRVPNFSVSWLCCAKICLRHWIMDSNSRPYNLLLLGQTRDRCSTTDSPKVSLVPNVLSFIGMHPDARCRFKFMIFLLFPRMPPSWLLDILWTSDNNILTSLSDRNLRNPLLSFEISPGSPNHIISIIPMQK